MDDLAARFAEVTVNPSQAAAGRALTPISERMVLGRSVMLFDGAAREMLAPLGEMRTPSIADIFVALMSPKTGAAA
jgi:ABC-2 type transport system ATP-binding protein